MTKKHFIALANAIRLHNAQCPTFADYFRQHQLATLADFCASTNPRFNRIRWLAYIAGECGPCGGAIKKANV